MSLVPEDQRNVLAKRKTFQACLRCKITKRKCDEERPCHHCVRLGVGHECVDIMPTAKTARRVPEQAEQPVIPPISRLGDIPAFVAPSYPAAPSLDSRASSLFQELDWLLELCATQGIDVTAAGTQAAVLENVQKMGARLRSQATVNMMTFGFIAKTLMRKAIFYGVPPNIAAVQLEELSSFSDDADIANVAPTPVLPLERLVGDGMQMAVNIMAELGQAFIILCLTSQQQQTAGRHFDLVIVNEAAARMYGYTSKEMMQSLMMHEHDFFTMHLHPDDFSTNRARVVAAATQRSPRLVVKTTAVPKEGAEFQASFTSAFTYDGNGALTSHTILVSPIDVAVIDTATAVVPPKPHVVHVDPPASHFATMTSS
eukprot:TRINITY_DN3382_c0_g1_i1.p1 TRINITY_DN3382_c0_g1~~TRINITY_DN3382_c0_g1_i1.p1  ORF type:complete len:371 (+),score=75.37 TRINITY_DN3382_c0_g1_i1:107-1219(+)